MGQNNFEKQVKEKLNNREIKPSANSWDRLDAMLTVEEKPKKKGFFWLNIAASFIVFASIGFYFYNQNEVAEPVKEVRSQKLEAGSEKLEAGSEKLEVRSQKLEAGSQKLETGSEIAIISDQKTENRKQKIEAKQQITDNKLLLTTNEQPITNNQQPITYNLQPTISKKYTSAEKLLAQISNSKNDSSKSYVQVNRSGKSRINVSSTALLADAEKEIDKTFKETILKKLNKNYQELTTAIAYRNYEE
jgi:ABC-type transporter Mla MlaB component